MNAGLKFTCMLSCMLILRQCQLRTICFATKKTVVNYKNMSTPGTVPKRCLRFSYVRSEDYELDQNFDET